MKSRILIVTLFVCMLSSCKKFIEVDGPDTSVSSKDIYTNDATAIGAITNLYANMSAEPMVGINEFSGLSCIAGLSADELTLFNESDNLGLSIYYQNRLSAENIGYGFWKGAYNGIYVVNAAIEGLSNSESVTKSVKNQLLGEAKFMRAFYYFYLINLYGDAPLVLETDYIANGLIARSSKDEIYKQIVSDLKESQVLLSDKYLANDCITSYSTGNEERVRPTKWVATAMLARVYLFLHEWSNAELQSTTLIQNLSLFDLESLDRAFLKNNKEAIWQLQPVIRDQNTSEANTFLLPETGPSSQRPVYLREGFVNSFEMGDQRKEKWINHVDANDITYYYTYKYKVRPAIGVVVTEYSTVFRLAEQYLIRAEARAQQGNLNDAIGDLDRIRNRAGLYPIKDQNSSINQADLINEILNQRQHELFTEWGHRWLDLKRTGKIDEVMVTMTPEKSNGGTWKNYQQLYPVYIQELQRNPNLSKTVGY